MASWRDALRPYGDRRILAVLALGFSSGLPLALTFSTLTAWLASSGVSRTAIGLFTWVGTAYAFKFLWSPLIDRLPLPLLSRWLGQRRAWGLVTQIGLIFAIIGLGRCDPRADLAAMAAWAVLVAFLSASQDIVIDAYRIESLDSTQQGSGAGAIIIGYRLGMLVSGAGALVMADHWGWALTYEVVAVLMLVGALVLIFSPEPKAGAQSVRGLDRLGVGAVAHWVETAVAGPFRDFASRPLWGAVLALTATYKLGEAMAGIMVNPLYLSLGFSLTEVGAVSKPVAFFTTLLGTMIGSTLANRLGLLRALLLFCCVQAAGNFIYILQAEAGHSLFALVFCVAVENSTSAMAGAAMVAFLSRQCGIGFSATQYALLSSLTVLGPKPFVSLAGWLQLAVGWDWFFALASLTNLPSLLILLWMIPRLSADGTVQGGGLPKGVVVPPPK